MVTTSVPEVHVHRPHINYWLVGIFGLVAILLAGIAGYAIAGGFTTESTPGQEVADRVMKAFR